METETLIWAACAIMMEALVFQVVGLCLQIKLWRERKH